VSQALWTAVDEFINESLARNDEALDAALGASAEAGLPAINVTPSQGKLLQILVQMLGARSILEIGTLGGYSTIWMARGLVDGGKLITLESNVRYAEIARANFKHAALEHLVELRVGNALETLPRLVNEGRGPFDFIFVDADKASYPEYFAWSLKLSKKGTVIVVDNVVRHGTVIDAKLVDGDVQGVRRFYEEIAVDLRVNATAIQTVGTKGWDGLAVIMVTGNRP
jgi:predicted O-methyltransferase YrrM